MTALVVFVVSDIEQGTDPNVINLSTHVILNLFQDPFVHVDKVGPETSSG